MKRKRIIKSAKLNRQRRFAGARCSAAIWHGPGHQSETKCQVTGPHKIHEAVYGSMEQTARWRGKKVFSGYFDEPPNDRLQ